ncbi:MAG TPA: C2 family cysteine protease, partial [Kofleriaceae bacterium]
KPLFVAAVKRATSLDAEQGVLPGVLGSGKYGKDEIRLFEVIKQQVDKGAAITAFTRGQIEDAENVAEVEKGNAGETKVNGLAAAHEYSVLDYKPRNPKSGDPILVQLRNPWGKYGRKYVEERGAKKGVAVQGGDGVFWIDIADMVSFFGSLTFLKI